MVVVVVAVVVGFSVSKTAQLHSPGTYIHCYVLLFMYFFLRTAIIIAAAAVAAGVLHGGWDKSYT